MGFLSRVRDILQGNLAGLLDRAEDPAKTVRLVVRDMEKALTAVRAEAARVLADLKDMERLAGRQRKLAADWSEKAEFALSRGREDLARAALVEQRKAQRLVLALGEEQGPLEAQLSGLEHDLVQLEAKLEEARGRERQILKRIDVASAREQARRLTDGPRVGPVFSRFAMLEREADLAEGMVEALALGRPSGRDGSGGGERAGSAHLQLPDGRFSTDFSVDEDAIERELARLRDKLGRAN